MSSAKIRVALPFLGLGLLLLAAAWSFLPPRTPPLLDGTCVAQPYLYLNGNPPAPSRSQKTQLQSGTIPAIEFSDNDQSPQVQILANQGSMAASSDAQSITMTITPIAPPAAAPSGDTIEGNVYSLTATADNGQPVTVTQSVTLVLLSPSASGSQNIERLDGKKWT